MSMQWLEAGRARLGIDLAHGARLASLMVDGWQLIETERPDPLRWGAYVLAPWPGRLRDATLTWRGARHELEPTGPPHALHGLVADIPWTPLDDRTAMVELPASWPWRGRVLQRVDLAPDHLVARLELLADEPMPAALGWHPWFPTTLVSASGERRGPVELNVQPGLAFETDAAGFPTGELVPPPPRPWDTVFAGLVAPPRLRWGDIALELASDCACWVIYDREPQAIAVEPWTAPPDALNRPDATIVLPGAPLRATMTWRWEVSATRG